MIVPELSNGVAVDRLGNLAPAIVDLRKRSLADNAQHERRASWRVDLHEGVDDKKENPTPEFEKRAPWAIDLYEGVNDKEDDKKNDESLDVGK